MNITQETDREHSQLFLVRLWTEQGSEGSEGSDESKGEGSEGSDSGIEWCGKLQHIVSGQAQYFRGWPTLIDLLLEMTGTAGPDAPDWADRAPPSGRAE
jgi:hypothetical protein